MNRFSLLLLLMAALAGAPSTYATNECAWRVTQNQPATGGIPFFYPKLPGRLSKGEETQFRNHLTEPARKALENSNTVISQDFQNRNFAAVARGMAARARLFEFQLDACLRGRCPRGLARGIFARYEEAFDALTYFGGYLEASERSELEIRITNGFLNAAQAWLQHRGMRIDRDEGKLIVASSPPKDSELADYYRELVESNATLIFEPGLTHLGFLRRWTAEVFPGAGALRELKPDYVAYHELDHVRFLRDFDPYPYDIEIGANPGDKLPVKSSIPILDIPGEKAEADAGFRAEELHAEIVSLVVLAGEIERARDFNSLHHAMVNVFRSSRRGEAHCYFISQVVPELMVELDSFLEEGSAMGLAFLKVRLPESSGHSYVFPSLEDSEVRRFFAVHPEDGNGPLKLAFAGRRYNWRVNPVNRERLEEILAAAPAHEARARGRNLQRWAGPEFKNAEIELLPLARHLEPLFERVRLTAMEWLKTHSPALLGKIKRQIADLTPHLVHPVGDDFSLLFRN